MFILALRTFVFDTIREKKNAITRGYCPLTSRSKALVREFGVRSITGLGSTDLDSAEP